MNTTRPKLTFPPQVARLVKEYYSTHDCILEYGSGGSTVLASEMPGKIIVTVESDPDWALMIKQYIDHNNTTRSIPKILHADIGKTGMWGYPTDRKQWKKYKNYSLKPWVGKDTFDPDLILIDGRFRAACFLASAISIQKDTIILFDDYANRCDRFHKYTSIVSEPIRMVDRMAIFYVKKQSLSPNYAFLFAEALFDPR
jgi:protein O-GlcNAc transferase